MKGVKVRFPTRNLHVLGFYFVLIVGLLFLTSCRGKETAEEPAQQVPATSPEAQVEELKKDVAARDNQIAELTKEKADLLNQVPEPYEVQKGDNHWQIAYDFLTQKRGVIDGEAKEILADTPLFHPILVGFKVWNYMYKNVFGSFIVQGDAAISPAALMRLEKKKLVGEILELNDKITALETEKEEKNKEIEEKKGEIEKLSQEKKGMESQIATLNKEKTDLQNLNKDLDSKLNSVYYFADTKAKLKANGKIKGTFLGLSGMKIKEVSFSDFQNRIDLREGDVIELSAGDFGIPTIKKVGVLPKHLNENVDYRVEIGGGGQSAKVHLLNKDKFLLARIVLFLK